MIPPSITDAPLDGESMRARKYLRVVAVIAWCAGIGAAAATAALGALPASMVDALDIADVLDVPGIVGMQAPGVFGLTNAVIVVVGELVLRRRLGRVRHASLVPRTMRTTAGGWLLWLCATAFALLLVVAAAGAALAEPDGRTLAYGTPGAHPSPVNDLTAGVFPGVPYGVSLLGTAVLLLIACAAALRLIEARPAIQDITADTDLRRLSARRVMRGCAAALLVANGGAYFLAGIAIAESFIGSPWHQLGFVVAAVGVALGVGGVFISLPFELRQRRLIASRDGVTPSEAQRREVP